MNFPERCTIEAATSAAGSPSADQIIESFSGNIEPVQVPGSYRLGILLVAVVMVILPLVYLAMIVLVSYLVYFHAVNHTEMIAAGTGRGKAVVVLVYLAPIISGAILIAFLLKPLFSRSPRRQRPRSLARDEEPLLFAFVDRICQAVHAPRPGRIDIDCEVNASASFRRFLSSDLVLTLGMPLVAGLNLRQFAGVLAHEFGHFSQGAGMRLTYIIRSISHWFTRVVYERDTWDEWLVRSCSGADLRISWMLYLARFFVWLTRKVLWVLMMVGHGTSGLMLRQMEFDADRHEARLAGSDAFESTARQLAVLNVAMQGAQSDLGDFYREGRLADDLPRLVMANIDQFTPQIRAKIDGMVDEAKTGWLDTHPADTDRIASARRENAAGLFRRDEPAEVLFRDFAASSKQVTWDFYRQIFGDSLDRGDLHPIDDLLARQREEQESFKALARYLQNGFSPLRQLRLRTWEIPTTFDASQAAAELIQTRERMLCVWPEFQDGCKAYDEADTRIIQSGQALALLNAKMRVPGDLFDYPLTSQRAASDAQSAATGVQAAQDVRLRPAERIAGRRLYLGLLLLHDPQVGGRLPNAEAWQAECRAILPVLAVVNSLLPKTLELRNWHSKLAILLGQLEGQEQNVELLEAIRRQMSELSDQIKLVRRELAALNYPFDHAKGQVTVAEFALSTLPPDDHPGALYEAAESLGGAVIRLDARMVGRLCVFAEAVESQLGLEPLPDPPTDDEAGEQPATKAEST